MDLKNTNVQAHNQNVGEVLWGYNKSQGACFGIFLRLLADNDIKRARAMWHSLRNDRTQRELLRSFLRYSDRPGAVYRKGILWSIDTIDRLSVIRNDLAHTEMVNMTEFVIPGLASLDRTRMRIAHGNSAVVYRRLIGDFIAISNYLELIGLSLDCGEKLPLVKRPRVST